MNEVGIESKSFSKKIQNWYKKNLRELPWRETRDPYKIWLSEIILQQTRVNQGLPYYLKFVEQYPTVFDLANAPEVEVLRLWQGLGYYSRARNLHACAKQVVEEYNGKFPADVQKLKSLKGIGDYTAAAIASISFQIAEPVLDGNVFRVISRVYGIYDDIADAKTKKVFHNRLDSLITETPDVFNQAMMEFGALHCTPKNPACDTCIFQSECHAYLSGEQTNLPVKSKKVKVRNRSFIYYLFVYDGKVYMKQRGTNDIWAGLFDFYLKEVDAFPELPETQFDKEQLQSSMLIERSETYKHVLTHQRISAQFCVVNISNIEPFHQILDQMQGFNANEILNLPKPKLIDRYLKEQFFSLDLV